MDASEITVTAKDRGRISLANGYASHGEGVRRVRGRDGKVSELWLAGSKLLPEAAAVAEIEARYGA
jgi:hypothetical protein